MQGTMATAEQPLLELDAPICTVPENELCPDFSARLRTAPTHGGNRSVPPNQWGMTIGQFGWVLRVACESRDWGEHVLDQSFGKTPDHVNAYQLNQHYVKPWTRGTGCSLSLALNPSSALTATHMVLHPPPAHNPSHLLTL